MNKTTKVISLALIISAVLATVIIPNVKIASANANPLSNIFSDVPAGSAYFTEVSCLSGSPYLVIAGYGDVTFKANQNITRGQASAFISRYHVSVVGDWSWKNPATPSFTDVPTNYLFYQQIETAKFYGFVIGVGNNMFAPADPWMYNFNGISTPGAYGTPITRGEFIRALYNYGMARNQLPACVTSQPTQPTADIKANNSDNPISVKSNETYNLSWTSTNATSCYATGSWSGTKSTQNNETRGPSFAGTYTYFINCTGQGGTIYDSVDVNVTNVSGGVSDPTVDIKANNSDNPSAIAYGTSANLTWTSSNAVSCNASGNWSGSKAINDSQSTGALTSAKTYTITCYNSVGTSALDSVTVAVTGQQVNDPTVDLTANPASVISGNRSNLSWTSSNADYCYASSGPWSGNNLAINSSQQTGVLTQSATFTITCVNSSSGKSAVDSATVTVNSDNTINVVLTASPNSITRGGSTTLTWTSTNASYCYADAGNVSTWYGNRSANSSEQVANIQNDVVFGITCYNSIGQSAHATANVSVSSQNLTPSVSIYASQNPVNSGSQPHLYWTSYNASSCYASGGPWSGTKGLTDNEYESSISVPTYYSITCQSSSGQTASANVTVGVTNNPTYVPPTYYPPTYYPPTYTPPPTYYPAPSLSISASPNPVQYGQSSNIFWTATNVDYCYASTDWQGPRAIGGQVPTGSLFTDKTYTLTCIGAGGTITRSAVVVVMGAPIITYVPQVTGIVAGVSTGITSLSISKSGTNYSVPGNGQSFGAWAGNELGYQITVINTGTLGLRNLIVEDVLSDRLNLENASDNGTYDYLSRKVSWKIVSLPAGESRTLSLRVKVVDNCGTGDVISNQATVRNGIIAITSSNPVLAGPNLGVGANNNQSAAVKNADTSSSSALSFLPGTFFGWLLLLLLIIVLALAIRWLLTKDKAN